MKSFDNLTKNIKKWEKQKRQENPIFA